MRRMVGFYTTFTFALSAGLLFLYILVRPTVTTEQRGYRGTGMEQNVHVSKNKKLMAANLAPVPQLELPPGHEAGPKAGQLYQNVQVLGHLSLTQFNRLMVNITAWVAPDHPVANGCGYCHIYEKDENGEEVANLASDKLYTKRVARRMFQMTQHINSEWQSHVGMTGVTCYTCHRGKNVPEYIWFTEPRKKNDHPQRLGNRAQQNYPEPSIGLASLPYDPYTPYLLEENEIRVLGTKPLPYGNRQSIKQTEWTYALMMHMSVSLGVNCTYCHNSRSVAVWEQSPPTRATAWYGIRMVRSLNQEYLVPLQSEYPDYRLGKLGDAPKQNCATCHQGVRKPLYGARMLYDFPSLAKPGPSAPQASLNSQ